MGYLCMCLRNCALQSCCISTPKELHKWIKIMLDSYLLNKEDTELKEVQNLSDPIIIQRLFILKKTLEDEYLQAKDEKYNEMEE